MKNNLLHYSPEEIFGLPGLDEKYQWAAIDEDGAFCFYTAEPDADLNYAEWSNDIDTFVMPLKTDYIGDWRESKIQRPVKIERGQGGIFWDDDKTDFIFGYLKKYDDEYDVYLTTMLDMEFAHFESCDPAALPKRIEIK